MLNAWHAERHKRIDYFLIWGHGLQYTAEIIAELEAAGLVPVSFFRRNVDSMTEVIKAVYSHDYAPLEHLKGKTRYLESTPPELLFIFVKNDTPNEDFVGEGVFRHLESTTVRDLKWRLRERYNPRNGGEMLHEHVLHASDNPFQAHQILRWLGLPDGIGTLVPEQQPFLHVPWYVRPNRIAFREVALDALYARNAEGTTYEYRLRDMKLEDTAHYRFLSGDEVAYDSYLTRFRGTALTEPYSVSRFRQLRERLERDPDLLDRDPILVREQDNKMFVVDGTHRACIALHMKMTRVPAAIVS